MRAVIAVAPASILNQSVRSRGRTETAKKNVAQTFFTKEYRLYASLYSAAVLSAKREMKQAQEFDTESDMTEERGRTGKAIRNISPAKTWTNRL